MGFKKADELPLTDECHHYSRVAEVPWDIQKYWHQRYSIFSYYDYDVHLTDDAWFGVTPEPVANKIAEDLSDLTPDYKTVLIDLFGGAGGNTIAFALSGRWSRVVAVERDAATLACAQHNAAVYGVPEGIITWVLGDCFDYVSWLKEQQQDDPAITDDDGEYDDGKVDLRVDLHSTVFFASPPWGGVSYRNHDVFDLRLMQPYNLTQLHAACHPYQHALYLPRTSDLRQIAKLAPEGKKVDVVQYCMEGASKALVAYVPEDSQDSKES
ncbi:hypothetical protein VTK73DRAFT_4976 [Phialemonium thermophilum]|uniref:Trimethylguanosine synthase n=1 Tax=Phialemonium thermophilum TaxID=223376 RepID=A0ABR3XXR0_9PEZI